MISLIDISYAGEEGQVGPEGLSPLAWGGCSSVPSSVPRWPAATSRCPCDAGLHAGPITDNTLIHRIEFHVVD